MSYARLELEFVKIADPGVEYVMSTIVDSLVSTPTAIDTCIVVTKGDIGIEERILRVATFAELITVPLETLPTILNRFSSATLSTISGDIQVGDTITLGAIPFVWAQFFGTLTYTGTVLTVISPTEVIMATVFPMFARNLTFSVIQGVTTVVDSAIDGVANRDYTGLTGTDFLAPVHYDTWSNLEDAENKFTSLKAQAQSLVDALNEDNYTGTFEELFE